MQMSRIVPLLRRAPLLPRYALSSSEVWIHIPMCGAPICATIPVVLFLETGSPAKSLSRKTVILSTCSCLRNRIAAFGFPNKIPYCTLQWNKVEFSWFSSSGPNVLLFPPSLICLGPKLESLNSKICIVLHLLSSELDSFFRPHPLALQFLSWCTHCLGVLVASRFFDDEGCISQAKSSVQEMSRLMYPDSSKHVSPTENVSRPNLRSNPNLPMVFVVYFDMRSESV